MVVQALMLERGSSGALVVLGRAGVRFRRSLCAVRRSFIRSFVRAVSRSVPNGYARAGRRSMAMKFKRELSPPVFVSVVNYRRPLIASRVSLASARKLFFSSARRGCGPERGRGLEGRAITSTRVRKNGILILGCG